MSEFEEVSELDKLKSVHSREMKELQAKIAGLKHAVTKNDKKKKKEVTLLVDSLEKELKDRHGAEISALQTSTVSINSQSDLQPIVDKVSSVLLISSDVNSEEAVDKKLTKAQIRREKKNEGIKRRAAAAEMDEKNSETSLRTIETDEIKRVLRNKNLTLVDIAPDGDCLYNSLSLQVKQNNMGNFSGKALREIAAKYIKEHSSEFLPFLTNSDDNAVDEFSFDEYCSKVEKNCQEGGDWGGEAELRAISSALECPIDVIQPNGLINMFGEDFAEKGRPRFTITYHRHAYSLGEHYNSTIPNL